MSPSRLSLDDASLWADWAERHGGAVRGYLLAMVRRYDLADDLTQEVFCRAWQARGRYREEGAARAYLLRIADRLAVDHHRRSGREVNLSEEGWKQIEPAQRAATPDDTLTQHEAFGQLTATLDSLSPPQRRVLLLRYYGELSFAEIAALLECPLSTALSHCHRGLLTLRKLLVETDK
jgi:RNA polymerase sigma factor (sigma-70 family)